MELIRHNPGCTEKQTELVNQIQQLIVSQQRLQGVVPTAMEMIQDIEQNNDILPAIDSIGHPNNIFPPAIYFI